MREYRTVMITGGAGFIGSHVVRHFVNTYPYRTVVNVDKLTYAGNLENLADLDKASNYHFEKGCITDENFVEQVIQKYRPNIIIHLAAESHVDRSIHEPLAFVQTNVIGTVNLLNHSLSLEEKPVFYQVSTDEVYGSLGPSGFFTEATNYSPNSPYSASKASADHFVRAYGHTFQLPILISNCSNNYGPNQFPEKLIPLMINNIKEQKPLPVYGDGSNVRDWLFVEDHVAAIDCVAHNGLLGETYNIGGDQEMTNLELVHLLCDLTDEELGRQPGASRQLIQFVKDRPGHDKRYAIDATKIKVELDWKPTVNVKQGLMKTIQWYLNNTQWLNNVTSGSYQTYYKSMYNVG